MNIDNNNPIAEFDIREDEEQLKKRDEICKLLLTAGYFRARIKGLPIFDKIVGGIVWCIQTCDVDINVDIAYHENLSIKQKIAVTERIVSVLIQMNSALVLHPHQIQGLDALHIFPIVQWLVKGAMEFRKQNEEKLKKYAIWAFDQQYQTDKDRKAKEKSKKTENVINQLEREYHPNRMFMRNQDKQGPKDRRTCVKSTLLEYAEQNNSAGGDSSKTGGDGGGEDELADNEETKKLKAILKLAQNTISDKTRREVLNKVSDHINSEQTLKDECIVNKSRSPIITKESLQKMVEKLDEEKKVGEQLKDYYKKLCEEGVRMEGIIKLRNEKISKLATKSEIDRYKNLKSSDIKLKEKFTELKISNKAKKDEINASIKDYEHQIHDLQNNEQIKKQDQLLLNNTQNLKTKIAKKKLQLAKKNREIVAMERRIDDAPSQVELNQYQYRFRELADIMQVKHSDTKKFFSDYNTLVDQRLYLNKEFSSLNSIQENYETAMKSESGQKEFTTQLKNMSSNVNSIVAELKKKKENYKRNNETLLIEQNEYNAKKKECDELVKTFTLECKKNERLTNKSKKKAT